MKNIKTLLLGFLTIFAFAVVSILSLKTIPKVEAVTPSGDGCEHTCPVEHFSASHQVVDVAGHYGNCPDGYSVDPAHDNKCIKPTYTTKYADKVWADPDCHWGGCAQICPTNPSAYTHNSPSHPCSMSIQTGTDSINRPWIDPTYKTETFTADVQYTKDDEDPHKCHRPTGTSVGVPSWAMSNFNALPEWETSTTVVPDGYYKNSENQCVPKVHVCTDPEATNYHDGELDETELSDKAACTYAVDQCTNIEGTQTSVPEGMTQTRDEEEGLKCFTHLCTDSAATNYHEGALTETEVSDSTLCTYPDATPTPTPQISGWDGKGDGLSDGRSDGRSSCPSCTAAPQAQVLGAQTGEVLGATTDYAPTGVAGDMIMNVVGALGGLSTASGLVLAAKKKLNV